MTPKEMLLLFEFNAWANQRIMGAVQALSPKQLTENTGASFSTVRDTLMHIFGVEWVWLERLQGRSPAGIPDAKEFADLTKLCDWYAEHETRLLDYVRGISQTELDEVMDYKTFSFGPGRNARWQMMQHVVNHGTYHRGQITTMLRQLGAKGVGTDLITFYREKGAAVGA